jgi:hypothetical protein
MGFPFGASVEVLAIKDHRRSAEATEHGGLLENIRPAGLLCRAEWALNGTSQQRFTQSRAQAVKKLSRQVLVYNRIVERTA